MLHEHLLDIETNLTQTVFILILFVFCLFICLFCIIYVYLTKFCQTCIKPEQKIEYISRINSSIHAVISATCALFVVVYDKELSLKQPMYKSSLSVFTMCFVMGYFIYDLLIMAIYKPVREKLMIIHHTAATMGLYYCCTRGVFYLIMLVRVLSEFSTPFINIRWFLFAANMKNKPVYIYNGYLMLLTFGIFRIIPIIPLWLHALRLTHTPAFSAIEFYFKFLGILSSVPLDIMNIYWFWKILKGCLKHTVMLPPKTVE